MIPVLIILMFCQVKLGVSLAGSQISSSLLAMIIFAVAVCCDYLDGYLARNKLVTNFLEVHADS